MGEPSARRANRQHVLLYALNGAIAPGCSVCGREFPESQLRRCYDCGKAYCPECAEKDPTIKELGVCPDCEEVFEAEEDYWGWGEEEEW